jgi:hypothetical protein
MNSLKHEKSDREWTGRGAGVARHCIFKRNGNILLFWKFAGSARSSLQRHVSERVKRGEMKEVKNERKEWNSSKHCLET